MIVGRSPTWRHIAAQLWKPLAVHVLWAVLVSIAFHEGQRWTSFPALPISLLAATIGILLGFRNTSGYDRWWEARTLWGGIVNQSRTLARQVLTFLPSATEAGNAWEGERRVGSTAIVRTRLLDTAATAAGDGDAPPRRGRAVGRRATDGAVRDADGMATGEWEAETDPQRAAWRAAAREVAGRDVPDPAGDARAVAERCHFEQVSAEARELVHAQIGLVNAMRCHLRRQDPIPEIVPFFRPAVVDALREEQNVPAAILAWMSIRLRRLLDGRRADDIFRLTAIDGTLAELTNLLGGCERIKNTPIPRQYDFLPGVMVRAYLVMLPFGVVADLGYMTAVVTAVIAALFLGLDQIGRNVERPFEDGIHDTPMTALCRTIEINLRQVLGERDLPPAVEPRDGVLY